jgi:16S rRNA (cytosine967-C5)-methyltransferase
MKPRPPSAPRARAVDVLQSVLRRGAEATPLLAAKGAGLSPADRDLMRELVLGVLRRRSALDHEIASVCRAPLDRLAPGLLEILEVALYQLRHLDRVPGYAAVDEAVRAARWSGGERPAKLVNAVLRKLADRPPPERSADLSAAVIARETSHPEFLVRRWVGRFGRETACRILEADNVPSGLDLLVNPRRTSRTALREALSLEGIESEDSRLSPLALSVLSGNPIASPLLEAGHFTVQDSGAQALALLLPAGDVLVDLAAAPGGKSFAALALGRARWTISLDRSLARLRRFAENSLRLGMPEARAVSADFLRPPLPAGRFDRILLDAPCSGTGTLRKIPEIRYRLTPAGISRLAASQAGALREAAGLLAPGGYLLYATCSLEAEENDEVVSRVLAELPDLALAPIEPPEALSSLVRGARFQILPDSRTDGFTAHLLRRDPAARKT